MMSISKQSLSQLQTGWAGCFVVLDIISASTCWSRVWNVCNKSTSAFSGSMDFSVHLIFVTLWFETLILTVVSYRVCYLSALVSHSEIFKFFPKRFERAPSNSPPCESAATSTYGRQLFTEMLAYVVILLPHKSDDARAEPFFPSSPAIPLPPDSHTAFPAPRQDRDVTVHE